MNAIARFDHSEQLLDDELLASPRPVLVILFALGTALFAASYREAGARAETLVAVFLYLVAGGCWALEGRRPLLARWLLVLFLMGLVDWLAYGLRADGLAALRLAATGLAAVLLGPWPAASVALGETLLTGLVASRAQASVLPLFAELASVWIVWAVAMAAHRPAFRLAGWSVHQASQAQALIEQTRSQRQQLKQALNDLAHANRQTILMNEKLAAARLLAEEAQKAKSAFVAKVSHEFRTPLNLIIGLIDLITETPDVYGDPLPAPLLEDMEIVHNSCQHLSSMVNDVLSLSQMEAGSMVLHREDVHLSDLLERAVAVVQPLLEIKHLTLRVDVPGDLPSVYCDRTRVRQVILNLVSNAARFTERGSITVRATQEGGSVQISVTDTGPGIAADDRVRIFEPFFQASQPCRTSSAGTGLGLSISKQFVELHGGRMWVESQPGVGSTFSFMLPIAPPSQPSAEPTQWLNEEWLWRRRTSRPELPEVHLDKRFLICSADDGLPALLGRYAGDWDLTHVADLERAREVLSEAPAQAVLISDPDPQVVWRTIQRARDLVPDTPVLGCSLPSTNSRIALAGASGYVTKPFKRSELEDVVADALRRQPESILVADDDDDTLRLMTRLLRASYPDASVLTARTGAETLATLRSKSPDLLLLDVILPDLDGWAILAAKKEDPAIADITTVLVSAQDPRSHPPVTPFFAASTAPGLGINDLLRCSYAVARCLTEPDSASSPTPR
jgi:signal transduction histidine kinase/CheY-like chemotaxis protein